jgi:hypothetical protein
MGGFSVLFHGTLILVPDNLGHLAEPREQGISDAAVNLLAASVAEAPMGWEETGFPIPYGSKYLLRKCLGYHLLEFGGFSTFSDSVWIHRDRVSPWVFPCERTPMKFFLDGFVGQSPGHSLYPWLIFP